MRPVFEQAGSSCNQAAGIGYTFTYEANRLRNASALLPENQYPPPFTFCFSNFGGQYNAICLTESWEMMKTVGTPNVKDYGGMLCNGFENLFWRRWMTTYPKYRNALRNKVEEYYMLDVGTPQGLDILKHWLYDHLEGSSSGGLANFYANLSFMPMDSLRPGTPCAGAKVFPNFTDEVNHCITIVGYNDSIRWDYNGDGYYTNNIDITGDGKVTLEDWEVGGLKFVNSWGPEWGDSGYCYMMYAQLARSPAQGGIWNSKVFVVYPKLDVEPLLTFKVGLFHDKRNTIRVMAGVSTNISDTVPGYILEYPIFNYQGGDYYMQGGPFPPNFNPNTLFHDHCPTKFIEWAIDASPLLSYVVPGQEARFFLIVDERDPYNIGEGEIGYFSVIDHTEGGVEKYCLQKDIPILHNGRTLLSICDRVYHNSPRILDSFLPPAIAGQQYTHQMSASGGLPPYSWHWVRSFTDSLSTETIPDPSGIPVYPFDGTAGVKLDFSFPFCGKSYDSLFPNIHGYIQFEAQQLPWPYVVDEEVFFKQVRCIAPFMSKAQEDFIQGGAYIRYEGDSSQATFSWYTSVWPGGFSCQYALRLFPDGEISFFYDTIVFPGGVPWTAGLSAGDGHNYYVAARDSAPSMLLNKRIDIRQGAFPDKISLSSDGLLSGIPDSGYFVYTLDFKMEDYRSLCDRKTLYLMVFGPTGIESAPVLTEKPLPYPNPFRDEVTFLINTVYDLDVSLRIYDLSGRLVGTLLREEHMLPGVHQVRWAPQGLAPGMYFYRLSAGDRDYGGKMVKE